MSGHKAHCCLNAGNCPSSLDSCRRPKWYKKYIKPLAYCLVTSMLAMSVSHICDKYSATTSFKTIEADLQNLRLYLDTITAEMRSVVASRDELRKKLHEVGWVVPKMAQAISDLRNEVTEEMSLHTKKMVKALSPDTVRNMMKNELLAYDADKTGMTDYALESAGGAILTTRDTEDYPLGAPVLTLFGVGICETQNSPSAVIQTSVLPGECWAFKGSIGNVVIQLFGMVYISGVSMEHISPLVSPTGETTTAPREFSVWGLNEINDEDGFFYGTFIYDNSGPPLQYFEVKHNPGKAFGIVELKIHSNSGNKDYTCVYRIRIHGTLHR